MLLSPVYVLLTLCSLALASTQCYYPDSSISTSNDTPCSADGASMCCPINWYCLSNGLCQDKNANFFGRYTCTDRLWSDGNCLSDICTNHRKAAGNEAILKCPSGKYCCDADRSFDCCMSKDETTFFELDEGYEVAFIDPTRHAIPVSSATSSAKPSSMLSSTTVKAPLPVISQSTSTSATAQSSGIAFSTLVSFHTSESALPSTSFSASAKMSVSQHALTLSDANSTSADTSSATNLSNPTSTSTITTPYKNNINGAVLGPAIGVPVGLLAIGTCLFFYLRDRKRRNPDARIPFLFSKDKRKETDPHPGTDTPNSTFNPTTALSPTGAQLHHAELEARRTPPTQYAHGPAHRPLSSSWVPSRPESLVSPPCSATISGLSTYSGASIPRDYSEWSPTLVPSGFASSFEAGNGVYRGNDAYGENGGPSRSEGHGGQASARGSGGYGHLQQGSNQRYNTLPTVAELP